jgi:hypothetical protein
MNKNNESNKTVKYAPSPTKTSSSCDELTKGKIEGGLLTTANELAPDSCAGNERAEHEFKPCALA